MFFAFLIVLVLFFLPDIYISIAFLRHVPWIWRLLFFVPSVVGLLSMFGMRYYGFSSAFGTIALVALLCFALPKLFFTIISWIAKLVGVWSAGGASVLSGVGLVLACCVSLLALYGLTFGWKKLETKQVDLYFDNLPTAYDGYRIAHLSDLHVGTYHGKTDYVEKVVRRVNEENPDVVLFTGDIVNVDPSELRPYTLLLSQFDAPDGVYSVLGNHDYCLYGDPKRWSHEREGALQVAGLERAMGWTVLMNESRVLSRGGDRIALAGVENTGKPPFPQIGDLKAAVKEITDYDTVKVDEEIFTILLTHDPSHWRREVLPKTDIPLTLCGHTHAAQFKLGYWSPSSWMYEEWGGLYESDNQQLYISEGLGGTLAFRFGSWPQIVIITLHRK